MVNVVNERPLRRDDKHCSRMNLLTTGQVKASPKKNWVTFSRSQTFDANQIGKSPKKTLTIILFWHFYMCNWLNQNGSTIKPFLYVDENCYIEIKHLCVFLSLMSFFACLKRNIILVLGMYPWGDKCSLPFIKNLAHFYSGGVAKPEYIGE